MSVLSNIFKSVVAPVARNIPVVGDIVGGFIDSQVSEYESNKQWDKQTGWQKYMAQMQNEFNANQNDLSRQFAKSQQDDAQQFNAEQAQLARESSQNFEREMFNAENAYNSPFNQIKMIRDAGLNPNIFGSVFNSAIASSSPAPSASASSSPVSANALGSGAVANPPVFNNPSLMSAQIRLAQAQADKAESDVNLNEVNANRINELLSGEKKYQGLQIKLAEYDLNHMRPAQEKELLQTANNLVKQREMMDAQISNFQKQLSLIEQQVERAKIENAHLEDVLTSEILKNIWSAKQSRSSAFASEQQARLFAQETSNAIIQGGRLAVEFQKESETKESEIKVTKSTNDVSTLMNTYDQRYPLLVWGLSRCSTLFGGVSNGVTQTIKMLPKLFK